MDSNHKQKVLKEIVIGIAAIVAVLIILFVGINIGEHRARFVGQYGENYQRNFLGPRGGMMGGFFNQRAPVSNGAVGEIVSVNLPQLVVSGPDNLEKTILVGTSTVIRQFQQNLNESQLKTGDFITVLGDPNDQGQIVAKLIRVMPAPNIMITK